MCVSIDLFKTFYSPDHVDIINTANFRIMVTCYKEALQGKIHSRLLECCDWGCIDECSATINHDQ